jgi:hypothetical protein
MASELREQRSELCRGLRVGVAVGWERGWGRAYAGGKCVDGRRRRLGGAAAQASGISRPKASRVIASGSGPPRRPVPRLSIAAISSAVSLKSNTLMFSVMRLGLVDFGMTERPWCRPPAQHHLGRGLSVGSGDGCDDRVIEGASVATVAVEGDTADR